MDKANGGTLPQAPSHSIQHVLLPHNLALCITLSLLFQKKGTTCLTDVLSTPYLLHVYRLLLYEISEVAEPLSFKVYCDELANWRGHSSESRDGNLLRDKLIQAKDLLYDVDTLTDFFFHLIPLVDDDDSSAPFSNRSFFGHFCRRCAISFIKLSTLGATEFLENFHKWAKKDDKAGYVLAQRDVLRDDNYAIRITLDRIRYATPEPFAAFEKAQAAGDPQMAEEHLRAFFEQKFNEESDSNLRQHAMLNLVRTHLSQGHTVPARKLLREAITVARTASDGPLLQQCMSLLRRLEGRTRTRRIPLNVVQTDVPALEMLYDIYKLLLECQPLSDCFEKYAQALAVYDMSADSRGRSPPEHEYWSFHAVQAYVWRLAGCEKLAAIEGNIVLAFTQSGGNNDSRLKIIIYKAYQLARQGREDECFKLLLDRETWRGIEGTATQSGLWASEIWMNMLMVASRRGQHRQIDEFLKPRRPGCAVPWKNFFFLPPDKNALNTANPEDALLRVLTMRNVDHSVNAVDYLLKALWQSEYQGRFRMYRLAIVLLADLGLEFGMTLWSKRLVEEVLPQVIDGDDLELRGFACFMLARCILVCANKDPAQLRSSLPYLQQAESDYRTIKIHSAVQDVVYFTSVVYHNLGMPSDRDEAARRHAAAVEDELQAELEIVNAEWEEIWNLVCRITTALGSR